MKKIGINGCFPMIFGFISLLAPPLRVHLESDPAETLLCLTGCPERSPGLGGLFPVREASA